MHCDVVLFDCILCSGNATRMLLSVPNYLSSARCCKVESTQLNACRQLINTDSRFGCKNRLNERM